MQIPNNKKLKYFNALRRVSLEVQEMAAIVQNEDTEIGEQELNEWLDKIEQLSSVLLAIGHSVEISVVK